MQTKKEELTTLAKSKGFESKVIGKSVHNKTSNKPFYYLWMCELQKWLRDVHNIHIWITRLNKNSYYMFEYSNEIIMGSGQAWSTYEKTLEEALDQALELINTKSDD